MNQAETRNTTLGPVACLPGKCIILSAPHEAEHTRDGNPKIAEVGTAKLAFDLAERSSCAAIASLPGQLGDPNWDVPHPYFDELLTLTPSSPDLILDLHMMKPRGVDVCLGLGPNHKLADGAWQVLASAFISEGLTVSLNWPFPGGPRTITGKAHAINLNAVQIEMSWDCYADGPHAAAAADALDLAITRLKNDAKPN